MGVKSKPGARISWTIILLIFQLVLLTAEKMTAGDYPESGLFPNPFAQAAKLGKGINMGCALEATPDEEAWHNPIRPEYFRLMRQAGFSTVRIPVRWSIRADIQPPYSIKPEFFKRVDDVLSNAFASGLNVVIDIHDYNEPGASIYEDTEGQKERFLSIWNQIADHYRNMPDNLYLEVLNEPDINVSEETWNDLLSKAVKVIRSSDRRHTIIAGGILWNSIIGLTKLKLPEGESNLIAAFHFYDPMFFTHQTASWVGNDFSTSGVIWPNLPPFPTNTLEISPSAGSWVKVWFSLYNKHDRNMNGSPVDISSQFDIATNWAAFNDVPLWLGEFGAYAGANKSNDMPSRARWTKYVRTEAEKRNIGWAYWEFSSGFGIYDPESRTWRAELTNALLSSDK